MIGDAGDGAVLAGAAEIEENDPRDEMHVSRVGPGATIRDGRIYREHLGKGSSVTPAKHIGYVLRPISIRGWRRFAVSQSTVYDHATVMATGQVIATTATRYGVSMQLFGFVFGGYVQRDGRWFTDERREQPASWSVAVDPAVCIGQEDSTREKGL